MITAEHELLVPLIHLRYYAVNPQAQYLKWTVRAIRDLVGKINSYSDYFELI